MKGITEWVFSQLLLSKASLAASAPFSSFFGDSPTDAARSETPSSPPDPSCSSEGSREDGPHRSQQRIVEDSSQFKRGINDEEKGDPLAKVEDLRIKFFRLLRRFGLSHDNLLVAKVLYRVHLATSVRVGESNVKRVGNNRTQAAAAAEQEASGIPRLDVSIRILVLGKTGVGKSATINSIFAQSRAVTDAFRPATNCIQEVAGTINGTKVTFIDTPGFLPSSTSNMRRNRKIMLSVRRFIRKSPPDIILFFERLDLINMSYSDFPLLKLMTEVFGSAIWFNTILVMTHASSTLPEGPSGYPVSYESYVTRCTDLMQHFIQRAVSDTKLENPVLLVDNHPQCKKNFMGETILPNGQAWKSQFLLLCICTKFLSDVNTLLDFQDSIKLGPVINPRVPSLPHLLSSLLRRHSPLGPTEADRDVDEILSSDDEEDEYDQLPPIRILTKSQFEKLSKSQKKDYLDELDYREILFLKKHLKEESRMRRKEKLSEQENFGEEDNSHTHQASPEAVLLPDMAIPPSFDSDCPAHRYRCLLSSEQWLVRPVLDPQGWDHDVGFDGINLDTTIDLKRNVHASITGQMSKDKQDFSVHSECTAVYADPNGPTYSVGLDVQSAGKDLICTVHSNTKLKILEHNVTDCAVSVMSFENKHYIGAKLEDTIMVGKRLKFVVNGGQMSGSGQVACGGSFEATIRGRDYPVRNDSVSLSMSALSFNKDTVLSGGIESEFRPLRGMRMAVNANLNSQKMGKVSIKISSSERTEIALLALLPIFNAILRRKATENREALEMG